MRKQLLLLLMLTLPFVADAYDAEINGICYNFSGTTAKVTQGNYYGNITIPASVSYNGTTYDVTNIGDSAFYECLELTSVEIPNSVTNIGDRAFYECFELTSIEIPNSVTNIGEYAFYECYNLNAIKIPGSVSSIGIGVFAECFGVTSITVDEDNPNYDSRDNCNCIIETESNTIISGCKNSTTPNTVTTIGPSAFALCSDLTSIIIPSSVTTIGALSFAYCTGLTSITIPSSVVAIGNTAFGYCI